MSDEYVTPRGDNVELQNWNAVNQLIAKKSKVGMNVRMIYPTETMADTGAITSATYVDVAGAKINFTTTGGYVFVYTDASVYVATQGNSVYGTLTMNGSAVASTERRVVPGNANYRVTLSTFWCGATGAGNYEVALQWKGDGAAMRSDANERAICVIIAEKV